MDDKLIKTFFTLPVCEDGINLKSHYLEFKQLGQMSDFIWSFLLGIREM